MNSGQNNNLVQLLLDELTRLLPAQFEVLLVRLNAPGHFLSPGNVPQAIRAAELVQWAKSSKVLKKLKSEISSFHLVPVSSIRGDLPKTFVNFVGMKFVLIPAGKFLMGSLRYWDEGPVHEVTIKNPFYIGKYQVTQGEWEAVMQEVGNPSQLKGDAQLPVETVSWTECQDFLKKLNLHGKEEVIYRLPSEAEWEYVCRAGESGKEFSTGDKLTRKQATFNWCYLLDEIQKPSRLFYPQKTTPVGIYSSNEFEVFDMHGNVQEWCQDRWHPNYNKAPRDGSAWESGTDYNRVVRGGSWADPAYRCRSAFRVSKTQGDKSSNIGFRVVAALK